MALDTNRHLARLRLPQRAADHFLVHLLDTTVALLTGLRHIVAVNARLRIGVIADIVRRMAIGAHRRHCQPLLQQPDAVNRLGVVRENAVDRYIIAL